MKDLRYPHGEEGLKEPGTYGRIYQRQSAYYQEGKTLSLAARCQALLALDTLLREGEGDLLQALEEDLGKSPVEAYATEFLPLRKELAFALRKLPGWMKPVRRRGTVLAPFARYRTVCRPKGQVLIIAPFNYPLQLALIPLISALAAGNTVILKLSEEAPATAAALLRLVKRHFPPELVHATAAPPEAFEDLFLLPFHHYFFTGSTRIGKIILEQAARSLASATLELGGKSPVLVDASADLPRAARRILWGKALNSGQTCIAPDYVLVQEEVREALIEELKKALARYPATGSSRIISQRHYKRLHSYLEEAPILVRGELEPESLKMGLTLLDSPGLHTRVMEEEIFGPILPILSYGSLEEAMEIIRRHPDPLALYLFSRDRKVIRTILERVEAGGVGINDVISQILSLHAPFGGRGGSGQGSYHGKHGFLAFSQERTEARAPGFFEMRGDHPPYPTWLLALLRRL